MNERKTLRLAMDAGDLDSRQSRDALAQGAQILKAGGTVAFPTETVYGLGADAFNAGAVARIFEAKQRPCWDPLIVHVAGESQLAAIAEEVPLKARLLIEAFWPGPLTLLLKKTGQVPQIVTAGRPRVGVRMPGHPVARRLIELAGVPVAAPSANSFGRTSPTRAEFVLEDLDGRIDAVIDSGESSLGLESTVLDVGEDPPVLYRPGMVTLEALQGVCGGVRVYSELQEAGGPGQDSLPAPGVGLKHYAPRARLILFEQARSDADRAFALAAILQTQGEKVGMMLAGGTETADFARSDLIFHWGRWKDAEELARRLFAGLRELDAAGATVILCPLPGDQGLGSAIRDRLLKAAR